MGHASAQLQEYPSLKHRLAFLVVYGIGLYLVGRAVSGSWWLTGGGEWLWWMSAVALYVVSSLSAPFFVRPRDSLANAIASASMLFTVDLTSVSTLRPELDVFRWASFIFVVLTGILAVISIAFQEVSRSDVTWRGKVSRVSYQLTVPLGNGAVIFTPPALISIIGFHQQQPASLLWLAGLWVFVVVIDPVALLVKVYRILRHGVGTKAASELVGHVTRVDDPNIIRVTLTSAGSWKSDRLHTACLPGNRHVEVVPLFVQTQDDELIGTGLCCDCAVNGSIGTSEVWAHPADSTTDAMVERLCGKGGPASLIGFVVEDSDISALRFEVTDAQPLQEGAVVFVCDRDLIIYYQLLNAVTTEELFTQNPRGTHIVHAAQLGTVGADGGFHKYGWVPPMNAPVFLPKRGQGVASEAQAQPDEFSLGTVAETGMCVKASLRDMADYHTAVLGVTGTGKTELVFDLIEAHVKAGRKVFCVDCTGEYQPRLKARLGISSLQALGFDSSTLDKLDGLVNAPEFGEWGGKEEKKKLSEWVKTNQAGVDEEIAEFMGSPTLTVGIFELPDIANTRATLRATEMYITSIFGWARKNRKARDVVVVLEEAHTVVPEWNLYRYDKADTDAVVGRMSQIALQGRKYGVGLLLVSQRTALVSKTLLSQCNTCICFAMYDKTGLDYLESVFASAHVRAIPNLRFRHAIAFGKGVKSERPIIFEIPFDKKKKDACEALNRKLVGALSETVDTAPMSAEETSASNESDDIPF